MLTAQQQVDEFIHSINMYIEMTNASFVGYNEKFKEVASISIDDIDNSDKKELINYALILQQYGAYLQDELNRNTVVLNWCESVINDLIIKYEKEHGQFDKYTKYEIKRSILFSENSFAEKINEIRMTAHSRVTILDGKIHSLKRMSDIMLERAKYE